MTDDEFDLWLENGDHAVITITDARGRTLLDLVKATPNSEWFARGKPDDIATQRFYDHPLVPYDTDPTRPREWLKTLPDGRQRLDVPGPPVAWEKLPPILDRLAEHGFTRISVDELRTCIT